MSKEDLVAMDDSAIHMQYPIQLNLHDDEEDAGDENDSHDSHERTTVTTQTNKSIFKSSGKIPLQENAIQECFLLAIKSHDNKAITASTLWQWRKPNDESTSGPAVDPKVEEEVMKTWNPRPLFLPTWAVQDDAPMPDAAEEKSANTM